MKTTKLAVAAALAAMVLAIAAPASAAKPTNYDLTVPDGLYGQTVTATVGTDSTAKASSTDTTEFTYWRVLTRCYQDGQLVMKHYSLFDGTSSEIPLGPTRLWQEGDADCTSELGYFHKGSHTRWRSVDKASFTAMWPAA